MGRRCKICGAVRAYERYGGKGFRAKVCDRCRRMPKVEIQTALLQDEVSGFLYQSHISKKNISRLAEIKKFEVEKVARMARAVSEIARVAPNKRKRWKRLRTEHSDVFELAIVAGLIFPNKDWDEYLGASPFESDFECDEWDACPDDNPSEDELNLRLHCDANIRID